MVIKEITGDCFARPFQKEVVLFGERVAVVMTAEM